MIFFCCSRKQTELIVHVKTKESKINTDQACFKPPANSVMLDKGFTKAAINWIKCEQRSQIIKKKYFVFQNNKKLNV